MKRHHVQLSEADRAKLTRLLSKGPLRARQFKRATGRLELDRGTLQRVAETLDVDYNTVAAWRDHSQAREFSRVAGPAALGTAGRA